MAKECAGCRKPMPFWKGLADDLCADCREAADQAAVAVERAAAAQAQRELDARLAWRTKCPVCGSGHYRVGRLPDAQGSALTGSNRARFRPEENWIEAYPLEALACMDCGHVRLFLFDDDRAFLRQEKQSPGP